jgi:hypothetical protein
LGVVLEDGSQKDVPEGVVFLESHEERVPPLPLPLAPPFIGRGTCDEATRSRPKWDRYV